MQDILFVIKVVYPSPHMYILVIPYTKYGHMFSFSFNIIYSALFLKDSQETIRETESRSGSQDRFLNPQNGQNK